MGQHSFLRLDASAAFHAGLNYLEQTGDSLFHPDTIHLPLRASNNPGNGRGAAIRHAVISSVCIVADSFPNPSRTRNW